MAKHVHAEAYHRLLELVQKKEAENRVLWKEYHNLRLKILKYCPSLIDDSKAKV